MKKIIILSISLWLGNNYFGQTKWIAHKSHSGKMNTFSLKSPDNLGCMRGDFLELNASNFDVLGNECTRPIILENGMVIKDPKLDSAGFADSHKEINRLAKKDSINYYPYKVVYDSIRKANYPILKTVIDKEIKTIEAQQEVIFIKHPSKEKKENNVNPTKKPIRVINHPNIEKPIENKAEPNKTTTIVKSSSFPILPTILLTLGILGYALSRKYMFQK